MVDIEADIEDEENKNLYISKEYLNFEDSYYLYGFCLPFKQNFTTCNQSDVKEIVKFANLMMDNYLFPNNSKISISIINNGIQNYILNFNILQNLQFIMF